MEYNLKIIYSLQEKKSILFKEKNKPGKRRTEELGETWKCTV